MLDQYLATTRIESHNHAEALIKKIITISGIEIAIYLAGEINQSKNTMILAHGWGQSATAFLPLIASLKNHAVVIAIDFPGFGSSQAPPLNWQVANYAKLAAELIQHLKLNNCIWVGHSFGCRVGIRLAANYPELVTALVLIAAPGIPYKNFIKRAKIQLKINMFKLLKRLIPEGIARNKLRVYFGSADYQTAGAMRPILINVLAENLTESAKQINCKTILIYGSDDQDTPPRIGELYTKLIPNASLVILTGFDHNSILAAGHQQILLQIRRQQLIG